jgi:hypothetical protein
MMLARLQSQHYFHHDSTRSTPWRSGPPVIVRSKSVQFLTDEPRGLVRNISCRNVSMSCLPASNEDDSALASNKSCLSAAGRATLTQLLPTEQKAARCGSSISENPVEATCSLESTHCTPDIDLADELDEYDMVGIQIVGDKMRRRLAEKHRMLELLQSRSGFRYALASQPVDVRYDPGTRAPVVTTAPD